MIKQPKDAATDTELGFLLAMRYWEQWLKNPEGTTTETQQEQKDMAERFAVASGVTEDSRLTKIFLTFYNGIVAGIDIATKLDEVAANNKGK